MKKDSIESADREVTRLVSHGASYGERDVFQGKRRWARYYLGTKLEITIDIQSQSTCVSAVMHNISEGGIGFWSKDDIAAGTSFLVRECSSENKPWVPAHVTHSTLAINGYLIGAQFQTSACAEALIDDSETDCRPDNQTRSSPKKPERLSLTLKCCFTVGFAAGAGGAIGVLASRQFAHGWPAQYVAVASALVACAMAVLALCLALARPVNFLKAVRDEIRRTGIDTHKSIRLPAAPSREMESVFQALGELRAGWRTREDDERAQRQKLEEINLTKSNILNMVSHDLRTPLTSIRLYAEMMAEELKELAVADQRRFLEIITEECKRLSRLVDDLLEAQRLEGSRVRWDMRPQDLSKLIRASAIVFEPMAQGRSIQLTIDCPDNLPPVEADADKMSQVLSNLVSNALKYTPPDGKVHVSAKAGATELLICVTDNGPGIPRDKWDQIFDRFAQVSVNFVREISGVGLGLYIVRQIVARHHGRVWVDSELGKGSSFYVALPTQFEIEQPDSEARPGANTARAIVCDADPELAGRMAQTLRSHNFDSRVAHSGCRLLAQIVESQPDVVVTDLLLPDMNSVDLLASLVELKERHPFKLVVHTYLDDAPDLRRRGVDVSLGRPARTEELVQSVQVAHRRKSASGKAVLLYCANLFDLRKLRSLLLDRGHIPMTAQSELDAARMLRDYPVDVLVIGEAQATSESFAGRDRTQEDSIRTILVTKQLGRRERKLAEEMGAALSNCRSGEEEKLIEAIAAQGPALAGVAS